MLLESKEVKPEAGGPISWEKGPLTALESSLTSQTTFHLLGLLFPNLGGPSVWPEDLLTHSLLTQLPPGVPDSGGLGWNLRDGLCKERPRGADAVRPGPRLYELPSALRLTCVASSSWLGFEFCLFH